MTDVVLLAADKTIETGVTRIFTRHQSLGCSPFTFRSFVHPGRDPGCYRRSGEFLRGLVTEYQRAIVVFDREGSGSEPAKSRSDVEAEVESKLIPDWQNRAACVVVDPEIENWVWTDSPHLVKCLKWQRSPGLRDWLMREGFWFEGANKPARPKEALESILRLTGEPRSSALYGEIAERVSLSRCTDPAFVKLRRLLVQWFPIA